MIAGFFAPHAVWDLSVWGLESYDGEAAIRDDFLDDYWATWKDHHHKVEEVADLDHGVLFVVFWEDCCPNGSNARVQARHGDVYELAHGTIARITTAYADIDEGRAVAQRLAESRGYGDAQERRIARCHLPPELRHRGVVRVGPAGATVRWRV